MRVADSESGGIWVMDHRVDAGTRERLGDARQLADALSRSVGALITSPGCDARGLIEAGADRVVSVEDPCGPAARVATAATLLPPQRPHLVLAPGTPDGRAWAARLAARLGWRLFSPALQAAVDREGRTVVTVLNASGRLCRKEVQPAGTTAVLTLEPGVAEALPAVPDRKGTIERAAAVRDGDEALRVVQEIPADPRTVDIRYAERIVAGGRGVGGADGFRLLSRVAQQLDATVAASRVAVDLGWIERERQVGQTGKTVAPELYLACGISGASHHLAGMSQAKCIVAIDRDPEAPIFEVAHLGIVGDLHEVLARLEEGLAPRAGVGA